MVSQPTRKLSLASYWTEVRGWQMHYRMSPAVSKRSGLPVVMVHGLTVSGRYLLPTAAMLASNFPVYVPDLPGFGHSERPQEALTVGELARALADWSEQINLPRAHYLGNSLGCQILATFAARCPQRVERLVFVAPTAVAEEQTVFSVAMRGLATLSAEPPSVFPILLQDFLRAGLVRTVRTLRHLVQDAMATHLAAVQAPTLVVAGKRDHIVPVREAEAVTALLPAGRTEVIPGARHIPNYSHPAELARIVKEFFGEGESRHSNRRPQ